MPSTHFSQTFFSRNYRLQTPARYTRWALTDMKPFLIWTIYLTLAIMASQPRPTQGLWLFQDLTNHSIDLSMFSQQSSSSKQTQQPTSNSQQQTIAGVTSTGVSQQAQPGQSSYYSSLLSIAGIQPSSIASVLNTVGDTGFRYFNIQDQCRNRAACDLGSMLYKKLSFVHNWLIRTSVRTLTDMNNIYTQSWMEGMLGRNCTSVYVTCSQSPLEGFMNLALLQHLAL